MKQHIIEVSSSGESEHRCVDRRGNAGENYLIVIDMESGSGVVSFEFTPNEDCPEEDPTIWITHDVLVDVSESCASTINVPFQAFRLSVKEYKSGTIKARVVQGGFHDY